MMLFGSLTYSRQCNPFPSAFAILYHAWRYHGNLMELWSYSVDLSPTSLADITLFDLHKIIILVKDMHPVVFDLSL